MLQTRGLVSGATTATTRTTRTSTIKATTKKKMMKYNSNDQEHANLWLGPRIFSRSNTVFARDIRLGFGVYPLSENVMSRKKNSTKQFSSKFAKKAGRLVDRAGRTKTRKQTGRTRHNGKRQRSQVEIKTDKESGEALHRYRRWDTADIPTLVADDPTRHPTTISTGLVPRPIIYTTYDTAVLHTKYKAELPSNHLLARMKHGKS